MYDCCRSKRKSTLFLVIVLFNLNKILLVEIFMISEKKINTCLLFCLLNACLVLFGHTWVIKESLAENNMKYHGIYV